jgi:hypothetical protein
MLAATIVLLALFVLTVFGLLFFSILIWSGIVAGRVGNSMYKGKEENRYPWSS